MHSYRVLDRATCTVHTRSSDLQNEANMLPCVRTYLNVRPYHGND